VRASPSTRSYFLSHFHSDHYGGLDDRFGVGQIYCTQITASLVAAKLGVAANLLQPQQIGEPFVVEGVTVTFIDANHCPGAALLLFELPCGRTILHCGDMRYHPRMQVDPVLLRVKGKVDTVYLDTTYCEEKHTFPPQEDSIALVVEQVTKELERGGDRGCLVLLSAYTIGKEKVLLEVSRTTGHPIYVSPDKMNVLQCLDLKPEDLQCFTSDMSATPIHVTKMGVVGDVWPFFQPNFASIRNYIATNALQYTRALGVIPTGWAASSKWNRTHSMQTDKSGCFSVMLSPYSEHSNFPELQEFVKFIRPTHIVPTVYSDERSAKRMVARFVGLGLLNTTAAKRGFLALFPPSTTAKPTTPSSRTCLPNAPAMDNNSAASVAAKSGCEAQNDERKALEVPEEWAEAEAAWQAVENELDAASSAASATTAAAALTCASPSKKTRKRQRSKLSVELSLEQANGDGQSLQERQVSSTRSWTKKVPAVAGVAEGSAAAISDHDATVGLHALLDMGFAHGVAERALRVSGGDVEAAVGSLLYRAQI
jgi:DNA ligase-1